MSRTILVIDNAGEQLKRLSELLENNYKIIESAANEQVLGILRKKSSVISAVLIDITPSADECFELLKQIKDNSLWQQIPVIAAVEPSDQALQEKALSMGVTGFVMRPYNKSLLLHTLHNTINLCETSALINSLRRDKLTGIYNRETFFGEASRMISRKEPGYYTLSCFDIENFKIINDQYGTAIGDSVLQHIARCINSCTQNISGLCCRYTGDKFALLYPSSYKDSEIVRQNHREVIMPECLSHAIKIRIGRYTVDDLSLPVSAMYDRASLAELSIAGKYDVYIKDYDESMREKLLHEQHIVSEMYNALECGQFEPWYQPQYDHSTGALIGAEALVRWRRPSDGKIVPPYEFIPIFERNGFIYEMDKSVWTQVCASLHERIKEGLSPLPISVNISRHDIFCDDFFDTITNLIKKYNIPKHLLRLEITESAFSEQSDRLTSSIRKLVDYGFTVEIDDFGSGYSSLNTLKNVPASILKLDMKFLSDSNDAERGGNIIESVVRMAKWLGMSVIAEGVEEKEQADYLKSIGCRYIQGYYYARPMPLSEYEKLEKTNKKQITDDAFESVETYDNNAFWDPSSIDSLIFNSYVGGASVIEYYNGKTETVRTNDRLMVEFGDASIDGVPVSSISPEGCLDEKNLEIMNENIKNAITTQKESTCEVSVGGLDSGKLLFLRCTVRPLARAEDRYLLYCVTTNVTEIHMAEQKKLSAERLRIETDSKMRVILQNVNGGVSAIRLNEKGELLYYFTNDRYYEMYGYSKQEAERLGLNPFSCILPEDIERVMTIATGVILKERKPAVLEYRCRKTDNSIVSVRCDASPASIEGVGDDVIIAVVTDITNELALKSELCCAENKLKLIDSVTHVLHTSAELCNGVTEALSLIRDFFGGSRAVIYEFSEGINGSSVHFEASPVTDNTSKIKLSTAQLNKIAKAFSKADCLCSDDNALKDCGFDCFKPFAACAVKRGGKLIGLLLTEHPHKDRSRLSVLPVCAKLFSVIQSEDQAPAFSV